MKKMKELKKLVSLLLALVMCASLAACGGKSTGASIPSSTGTPSSAPSSTSGPTDAQFEAMADAYNQVADLYNDVVDMAEANGWTADPETQATLELIGITMQPVGEAMNGDMSALEGTDFDAAPDAILAYLPILEELSELVATPYGGTSISTDEQFEALTDAYNQVAVLYNDVINKAEANGWGAAPEVVDIFGQANELLTPVGEALNGDLSALDGIDLDELTNELLEIVPILENWSELVAVPYGDVG